MVLFLEELMKIRKVVTVERNELQNFNTNTTNEKIMKEHKTLTNHAFFFLPLIIKFVLIVSQSEVALLNIGKNGNDKSVLKLPFKCSQALILIFLSN